MSVLDRLRASLSRYRKRGGEQRGRIIFHAKRGHKAWKIRKSYERTKAMIAARRRSIRRHSGGAGVAIRWALSKVGITENPPGSNRGGEITVWQQAFGSWLVGAPWCGVFVGTAMVKAGVQGVNSRVAAVAFIEDDARAGRNGFEKLVSVHQAKPGDAVCLFGRGIHVELVERVGNGVLYTVGGNTSPSNAGSQSNGGGCFRRARAFSQVHAVARPRYPS
jgi:hypothetical protein